MAERAAGRQDLSLDEKVKMVNNQIQGVNRTKFAYANIDIGKGVTNDVMASIKALEALKEKRDEIGADDFKINQ